jgi:hypothetical protein
LNIQPQETLGVVNRQLSREKCVVGNVEADGKMFTLKNILNEVGRIYAPYLIGNARAVMDKADKLKMELDGKPWEQNPFVYQAKCVQWLREAYAALLRRRVIKV